jgi:hypothetical protein
MGLLLLAVLAGACNKWVEVKPPSDIWAAEMVFSSDATATASINGMYSMLVTNQELCSDLAFSLYPALLSDELITTSVNGTRDPFRYNALPVTNVIVAVNFWKRGYELIYQVNNAVEQLTASTTLSEVVRKQLLGEATFLRAFLYFQLVNLFGEVPLQTSTDYTVNQVMPRTGVDKVYQQIITDLLYAETQLPSWHATRIKSRPAQEAAQALLAKVYLYRSNWEQAEAYATKVIATGDYRLEPQLQNVFLVNSAEAIWQLGTTTGVTTVQQAAVYIPPGETFRPPLAVTTSLLQAFEPDDQRKQSWLKYNTIGSTRYYYPYKFRIRTEVNTVECITPLRLAELYLLRAEARAQQQNKEHAVADLNETRSRAGLLSLDPSITPEALLLAIEQERRIELSFEWANRWFDLKRTGRIDTVLGAEKGTDWQFTDRLLPIPDGERQLNNRLEQNEGYR